MITDIPESWLIPEKNHSARNIYPTIFSIDYWFDKIDVSDNFVNLSEHFMQMTGDLSFEKRTQRELAVLLCFGSVRITGLQDMAIYLQLIIKITQSDSSGFQSKD